MHMLPLPAMFRPGGSHIRVLTITDIMGQPVQDVVWLGLQSSGALLQQAPLCLSGPLSLIKCIKHHHHRRIMPSVWLRVGGETLGLSLFEREADRETPEAYTSTSSASGVNH